MAEVRKSPVFGGTPAGELAPVTYPQLTSRSGLACTRSCKDSFATLGDDLLG